MNTHDLVTTMQENGVPAHMYRWHEEDNVNTIKHTDEILSTAYEQDNKVVSIQVVETVIKTLNATDQAEHTTTLLKVISQYIETLCNMKPAMRNLVLQQLGLFNRTFTEDKEIRYENNLFKVDVVEELLLVTISKGSQNKFKLVRETIKVR